MAFRRRLYTTLVLSCTLVLPIARAQTSALDAAKNAYEKGEYRKVVSILEPAAEKEPNNGEIQLLLTKAYLETHQGDAAIRSAEKAVSIDPKNSVYHDWLGQAYGDKASHASMFSAYPLARKTQKEFDTAVSLDEHNYEAMQHLIDYDCSAPSMVGGGEDKAQPLIQKLTNMDAAEGEYAAGNCRLDKKDSDAAAADFVKSLESKPKSMEIVDEMAAYFANRGDGEHVLAAANAAAAIAPQDPRVKYFHAVGWILKGEKQKDAESILHEYLQAASPRTDYPSLASAHYWLGKLYEDQKNISGARTEYQAAVKLNPKAKNAQEALKRLGSN
jgi:tetratricopeptide (TPR) repeat protein